MADNAIGMAIKQTGEQPTIWLRLADEGFQSRNQSGGNRRQNCADVTLNGGSSRTFVGFQIRQFAPDLRSVRRHGLHRATLPAVILADDVLILDQNRHPSRPSSWSSRQPRRYNHNARSKRAYD
jgi:hypothetical protein